MKEEEEVVIKELFYQWSKETLEDDRFEIMRDLEKWAEIVRTGKSNWGKLQGEFLNAVYDKYYKFEERLLSTPEGVETMIKWFNIGNKDVLKELWQKHERLKPA